MSQHQYELMDIGTNPYMTVQERKNAIEEYKMTKEVGESSRSMIPMPTDTAHNGNSEATVGHLTQVQENQVQHSATTQYEQGIKRKSMEDEVEEATFSKRLVIEQPDHGLVVLHKPPLQP